LLLFVSMAEADSWCCFWTTHARLPIATRNVCIYYQP